MARYIDADAFKQKLADKDIFFPALYANELNEMPTADVVPRAEIEREIGEEIYRIIGECHNETWVCLLMKEFADRLVKGGDTND